MAAMPFVRFVGISGGLAVDNVVADADIDYFVVTESGRLWTARAFVVALVRLARRSGHRLCPNYLLSQRALSLGDRNLFTAHELAQVVPVAGLAVYERLRARNGWTDHYLPNAVGAPAVPHGHRDRRPRWTGAAETLGRSAVGDVVERWECGRKVRRFEARASREASFGPDCCKGHFGEHQHRVLTLHAAATARLAGGVS
jgi:hypothetical protein